MDNQTAAGYEEVEHTADWQLKIWAPTLEGLFVQAARGMYALTNIQYEISQNIRRNLVLREEDHEGLLVSFLTELLYLASSENLAFDLKAVDLTDMQLSVDMLGGQITRQDKEIKAVTYHGLDIKLQDGLQRASIVFDV